MEEVKTSGSGYGSGDGYGYGDGYGDGSGIKTFNGCDVYCVDFVPTIINKIRNNIASGFILNSDLTLTPCKVVKSGNVFAHGRNLHEAMNALTSKLMQNMSEEERIETFWGNHDRESKYTGQHFFEWHNRLTGSCEMGRNQFVRDNKIDLEKEYTVAEFVDTCKNSYGGHIIRKLAE